MPAIASTWRAVVTPFHLMSFFQSFFHCQQAANRAVAAPAGPFSYKHAEEKATALAETGVLSVWAPLLLLLRIT